MKNLRYIGPFFRMNSLSEKEINGQLFYLSKEAVKTIVLQSKCGLVSKIRKNKSSSSIDISTNSNFSPLLCVYRKSSSNFIHSKNSNGFDEDTFKKEINPSTNALMTLCLLELLDYYRSFENIDSKEVFVIHCAAVVYIKTKYNPLEYNVNDNGTKNVEEKVLETKAKVIYNSSVHANPEKENNDLIEEITDFNPDEVHGLYAKTKAEAAKYVMNAVKNKNLNACIIHPSGIIGPYDYGNSHLTELVREVSNGKLFAIVKGGYDFVDVRDVAAAIITASKKDNKGECYILSNRYITIKELSDLICDVQGIKKIKIVLPICLAKIIAPFFEAYYNLKKQTPLFTKYSLYTLSSNSNFSNKKAKEELEYKNRDMKDTIKDTISWLNKKGEK